MRPDALLLRGCGVAKAFANGVFVAVRDLQETREELVLRWATPDRQEVEDLQEHARLAITSLLDRLAQVTQAIDEAVVADTQQGAARHIADAGCFDY